jgi:hypothetical protein
MFKCCRRLLAGSELKPSETSFDLRPAIARQASGTIWSNKVSIHAQRLLARRPALSGRKKFQSAPSDYLPSEDIKMPLV